MSDENRRPIPLVARIFLRSLQIVARVFVVVLGSISGSTGDPKAGVNLLPLNIPPEAPREYRP
jgi:hypothetical protein